MKASKTARAITSRVFVDSQNYVISNGHEPRGRDEWTFLIGTREVRGRVTILSPLEPFFTDRKMTFKTAVAGALEFAENVGANYIEVLWPPNVERAATFMKTTIANVAKQFARNAKQLRSYANKAAVKPSGVWNGRSYGEWNVRAYIYEKAAHRAERLSARAQGGAK